MKRFWDKLGLAGIVVLWIIGIINLSFFNIVKADVQSVNAKAAFMMDEKNRADSVSKKCN